MPAVEIMDGLFFIERGFLNGNHFVYRGEDPVLIDTAYAADSDTTVRFISELGVEPADVRLIINTHTHCDHIGGNRMIQDASGCDIAMHKIGAYFIDTRNRWATWWKYYDQEADFFDCTVALNDRNKVRVGPHEFEVIYTPGHASDGIVLYNRKEGALISSDTLWENDMAVMTLRVEGSAALFSMMESVERIERLDVNMVYPGHGKSFSDMKEAVGRTKARLSAFMENPEKVGSDLLKKIIVYTLMMRKSVSEGEFFERLMGTHWFPETVDLYFDGDCRAKYDEIMKDFLSRGIVKEVNGSLCTTVKP